MRRRYLITRRVPGLVWLRVFVSRTAVTAHGWMLGGAVYRGCVRFGGHRGFAVGFLAMPTSAHHPETFTGRRRDVHAAAHPETDPEPTHPKDTR